jgi:hypothetical protein
MWMNSSKFEKRREQKEERQQLVKQANAKLARARNSRLSSLNLKRQERFLQERWSALASVTLLPFWIVLLLFVVYLLFLEFSQRVATTFEQGAMIFVVIGAGFATGFLMITRREMVDKYGLTRGQTAVVWGWITVAFWGILLVLMILSAVFGF